MLTLEPGQPSICHSRRGRYQPIAAIVSVASAIVTGGTDAGTNRFGADISAARSSSSAWPWRRHGSAACFGH